jgi:hypothetical protein
LFTRFMLFALSLLAASVRGAKPEWPAVPPADELNATASPIEAEAPAEVLEWKIDINDKRYPEARLFREYVRYKIYAPDKAEELTRLNLPPASPSFQNEVFARLTLPDGKTAEFGKDDIRERSLERGRGSEGLQQRFLAVPGVVPGAVVEFVTVRESSAGFRGDSTVQFYAMQRETFPVRRFEWKCRYADAKNFDLRVFAVSAPTAELHSDPKTKTITATATNLPSVLREPHVGPRTDYTAALLTSYNSRSLQLTSGRNGKQLNMDIPENIGPWGPLAAVTGVIEDFRSEPTARVRKLAVEICEGAATPLEKARRIHNRVQQMYLKSLDLPRRELPNGMAVIQGDIAYFAETLDDILDFEKPSGPIIETMDYFWLAVGLYRAAGLETKVIMLPDRNLVRFDQRQVSQLFLAHVCAGIRIDGAWHFSHPLIEQPFHIGNTRHLYRPNARSRVLLPFGMLPWKHEGQVGLIAQKKMQEFIPIPFTPPAKSMVANGGILKLAPDGGLSGDCIRRYTGHPAIEVRARLLAAPEKDRTNAARESLRRDLKTPEITVTKVTGLEDPDAAVEIAYTLKWSGYALPTKGRLVFRGHVFRSEKTAPFSSSSRRHPVHFHTPWQEVDRVAIRLPEGYTMEPPTSPEPRPGKTLYYVSKYTYEPARRLLSANREFSSEVIDVPVDAYPALKAWYDTMHATDQQEFIIIKAAAADPAPAAATPPAGQS